MKCLLFLVAAFFFFSGLAFAEGASVRINEIMYAPSPEFGDTYNEWVELYNPNGFEVNITGWVFAEETKNHTLSGIINPRGFLILARKPENFTQYYNVISTVLEAKFMLNNTGEMLVLKDIGGTAIDSVAYVPLGNATSRGKTLERNASGWFESAVFGGTPGQNNSIIFAAPAILPQNDSAPEPTSQEPQNTENNTPSEGTSLGSPAISIISAPASMRFGDYSSIQAQFYSGGSSFSEARIVAYVFNPHWISRELSRDDSTLRNSPYMSNVAAAIYNISLNSTASIILPLFLKCNKGNEFTEGIYSLRIRLYKYDGSWKPAVKKDTVLFVSGENPLCPEETVYVNVTSNSNITNKCPICPKQNISSSKLREDYIAFSAEVPESAFLGDNLTANITLKNTGDSRMFLEAYSYLHDHEKLLSQGFDGSVWRNTWAANSRKIEIRPNETLKVGLLNAPKNITSPGAYTYRIVVSDMNDSRTLKEANFLIQVKKRPKEDKPAGAVAINVSESKNATEITGRAVSTQAKVSVFGRITGWLKSLFGK